MIRCSVIQPDGKVRQFALFGATLYSGKPYTRIENNAGTAIFGQWVPMNDPGGEFTDLSCVRLNNGRILLNGRHELVGVDYKTVQAASNGGTWSAWSPT